MRWTLLDNQKFPRKREPPDKRTLPARQMTGATPGSGGRPTRQELPDEYRLLEPGTAGAPLTTPTLARPHESAGEKGNRQHHARDRGRTEQLVPCRTQGDAQQERRGASYYQGSTMERKPPHKQPPPDLSPAVAPFPASPPVMGRGRGRMKQSPPHAAEGGGNKGEGRLTAAKNGPQNKRRKTNTCRGDHI